MPRLRLATLCVSPPGAAQLPVLQAGSSCAGEDIRFRSCLLYLYAFALNKALPSGAGLYTRRCLRSAGDRPMARCKLQVVRGSGTTVCHRIRRRTSKPKIMAETVTVFVNVHCSGPAR